MPGEERACLERLIPLIADEVGQLHPVADRCLGVDAGHVVFDRFDRDEQGPADVLVFRTPKKHKYILINCVILYRRRKFI